MALRLTLKRRDVIRIGDVLIAVDFSNARIILIIDSPVKDKVVRIPGGMNKSFLELRSEGHAEPSAS